MPSEQQPHAPHDARTLGVLSRALRAHALLIAVTTLLVLAAALGWRLLRPPTYEAHAQLLVTPVSADDSTFLGFDVVRETPGDPTRTMQTAAALVESPAVAQAVARQLGDGWTSDRVLEAVEVEPIGQSNLLDVGARAGDPRTAQRLADSFARAALDVRSAALRQQARIELARLLSQQRSTGVPTLEPSTDLANRIDRLRTVVARGDPTLSISRAAELPRSPLGPPLIFVALAGLVGGLGLGVALALLLDQLRQKVRDEEEAQQILELPVLTRVPRLAAASEPRAGGSPSFPSEVWESFRTVVAQLHFNGARAAARGAGGAGNEPELGRGILLTSASSGDGKTTSATALAMSLAATGHPTILLDLDLRKPDVASRLGVPALQQLAVDDLLELDPEELIARRLVSIPGSPRLRALVIRRNIADGAPIDLVSSRYRDLLDAARRSATYVVVDSPPLGHVADALAIVRSVDLVLLAVRPGWTDRRELRLARDLLARARARLGGYIVCGVRTGRRGYYGYGQPAGPQQAAATGEQRKALARQQQ